MLSARNPHDADRIERAINWLGQNYSVAHNPGSHVNLLYYLYGLDRVGRLTARRFIPLPRARTARAGRLVPRSGRAAGPRSRQPVRVLGRHWSR